MVDISGLDKADVLAALWNNSQVLGMGILQEHTGPGGGAREMDREWAQNLLDGAQTTDYALPRASKGGEHYFDYLHGRLMKIRLEGDELDTHGYNRDLGPGRAEAVIARLRETGSVSRL